LLESYKNRTTDPTVVIENALCLHASLRACKYTDIYHRCCRCPKWIQGTLDDGRLIRQSANTRNWEKAELTARDLEDAANPHKPGSRTRVRIADAIQCFRDDNLDI